jgi:hypothetical protein
MRRVGIAIALFMTLQVAVFGQDTFRAKISGGGEDGKCTFEVEVDGVAEIEIRGDQGYLRTISGNTARWRRLDCNQALPRRPNDFRFKGIDGRGRQDLIRNPNDNRGIAVVRIEDPKNGSEGYTGDIMWRGGSDGGSDRDRGPFDRDRGGFNRDRGPFDRDRSSGGFGGGNWGGNDWHSGWGDTLRVSSGGSGRFDRDGGPRYDFRGVNVNISRSGNMEISFDTDRDRNAVTFTGRTTRINDYVIEGDLTGATNRGGPARANGRVRIRASGSELRSIDMDGSIDKAPFRVNWRN